MQDTRPLVIDQPEDQLDARLLVESVLPALRRLDGRRQVILATQDANFVVHADPAQIIVLEIDAKGGRVALEGALEQPAVRDAIVQIVAGEEVALLGR